MKGINYSEDHNYFHKVHLSEKQLEMTKRINEAVEKGIDYDTDDGDDCAHPIDCKYYTIDSFNKRNSKKKFIFLFFILIFTQ